MTAMTQEPELTALGADIPISIGQAKRVLEWWCSSESFREIVDNDPERAMREYPIDINPEWIRPLWDPFRAIETSKKNLPVHPVVTRYREWIKSKTVWRTEIKEECSPLEPRFRAWRLRQICRNTLENGSYDNYIIHTPLAIELTDGCSVGCWFCGVGATKVGQSWKYEENAELWHGIVSVLHDKIGSAAKWGFCYWATDPLDNPDYEHFANVFCDIIGMFPQTTTAQGHKDPERVRELLKLSEARGCRVNRFSVLTEPLLRKIHATYTADELVNVEIVSQMQGATTPKSDAGAFRKLAMEKEQYHDRERKKLETIVGTQIKIAAAAEGQDLELNVPLQPGTIACVSGFLLNVVKRSVKLISPCRASARWPLGYIVFEEDTFTDAADLERIVDRMMDTHMPLTISEDDPIRLHPGLSFQPVDDGFHLVTPLNAVAFTRPDMASYLQSVGSQLIDGKKTAAEIALRAHFEYAVPEINTIGTLALMFERGVLVDAQGRIGETVPA